MSKTSTDKKTKITSNLKSNGNSKLNKSFQLKINSFLSKPVGKLVSLTLALILIVGIVFGAYNQIVNNNDTANAAINCPSLSKPNSAGNGCVSTTPSGYDCTGIGGTVSGTNCVNTVQTCPQGGTPTGTNCVASNASPVQTGDGCVSVKTGNGPFIPFEFSVNGVQFCYQYISLSYVTNPNILNYTTGSCNVGYTGSFTDIGNSWVQFRGFPLSTFTTTFLGTSDNVTFVEPRVTDQLILSGISTVNGEFRPPTGSCSVIFSQRSSGIADQENNTETFAYYKKGLYTSSYSYPATPSTTVIGPATPVFGTVVTSGVTYTPTTGQITGFSCTPTSVASGGNVTCTGTATGAPAGVPYFGDITVSVNNGGTSITVPLASNGTFSATVGVGTNTGSTPVTKTATTSIGGSSSITVNPATTVIDPDLVSGPGSIGNSTDCVVAKSVTIGTTYTCNFPINGTGPFVLPSGGISTRTNQTVGSTTTNSNVVSNNCSITGTGLNILTCTGISTTATPALTAGNGNVQLAKGTITATSTFNTKGTVTLTNAVIPTTPLTDTDLDKLTDLICNSGTSVLVNSFTTCTFTLPTNKTLPTSPNSLKLGIGNSTPAGTCSTGTGASVNIVTCINVPTGSQTGQQIIYGQIGTGTKVDTTKKVTVIAPTPTISDTLFIPDTAITLTPNPVTTGLSIFGATDYTIVVKDDRMVTTPNQALNSSTAVCTYRVKELSAVATEANRGYTKLTSTIISPYNNGGTYNANSNVTNTPGNTTPTPQYEVNYNTGTGTTTGTTNNNTTGGTTNLGTSIKITKENQKFVDYNLEIRCKRNSDGQLFGRDERINFLFGAYSIVTVNGVVVV